MADAKDYTITFTQLDTATYPAIDARVPNPVFIETGTSTWTIETTSDGTDYFPATSDYIPAPKTITVQEYLMRYDEVMGKGNTQSIRREPEEGWD